MNTYDFLVKLLIIGDSGVGKTNILLRACDNKFVQSHLMTIGVDFKIKTIQNGDKKIKMQIWDTAGQDRFKTITQTYYKGAMGIILTYAVNDRQSFKNIDNWIKQIDEHASENVCLILVGNKCDAEGRVVEISEGRSLAAKYKIPFFETSALTGENISDVFDSIASEIRIKILETDEYKLSEKQSQNLVIGNQSGRGCGC